VLYLLNFLEGQAVTSQTGGIEVDFQPFKRHNTNPTRKRTNSLAAFHFPLQKFAFSFRLENSTKTRFAEIGCGDHIVRPFRRTIGRGPIYFARIGRPK
jgi:hypothetical protein